MFTLKPPKEIATKNFTEHTYFEVVTVKDGTATCKRESSRNELLARGWTEVGAVPKADSKPASKKKGKKK